MKNESSHNRPDYSECWDSFVAEVAKVQPGLRAFVRSLLPNSSDTDDVVQETNLVLWRKREEYDASRPFGPWARRIAYFQTLAHLKSRSRSRESQFSDEWLEQIADEVENRAAQMDDRVDALRSCLSKLPPKDRTLVQERYAEGTSVKGMASASGRSADAVSMHLYRLRKKLATCIDLFTKKDAEMRGDASA